MQYCLHGQVTVSLVGRRRVRRDIFRRRLFILFTVRTYLLRNRYGQPIHVADYAAEFLSGAEGAEKTTVKKLTKEIGSQLVDMTINAPNWFISFEIPNHSPLTCGFSGKPYWQPGWLPDFFGPTKSIYRYQIGCKSIRRRRKYLTL